MSSVSVFDPTPPRSSLSKNPLNVLQIGAGWFPEHSGGLERVFYELTRHLPSSDVDVRGFVTGSPTIIEETAGRICGFQSPDASLLRRWFAIRSEVSQFLTTNDPDIVAAHFALYALPILPSLPSHTPFVVHFHGPWAFESRAESASSPAVRIKSFVERRVYNRADHFIVLSEAFRDLLCRMYGVDPSRVTVIPGGVDSRRFWTSQSQSQLRRSLDWPTDRPIVLSVRRLTTRMGLENLIDAMNSVRDRCPDALLLIAGKGPLADMLQNRIDAHDLQNHVRLLGFVSDDDLAAAYGAADLSIVPTLALEGFGLTTLESLAAGTPVLVTPVGGLPEAVRGLSDTLVLHGHRPEDLSDGISDALLGQRALPSSDACLAYVRDHHDWSVIARATSNLYRNLL